MRKSEADIEIARSFIDDRQIFRAIARRAGGQDVDDVVQDAFERVVATSRREDVLKPVHLLARIVRNVAIDRLRRRSSRGLTLQANDEDVADPVADPERRLIGAQRLRQALAVIEAMPPRRREVFLMHRVEELTYVQIARKLGISIKAVEKHIGLALKQLVESDD